MEARVEARGRFSCFLCYAWYNMVTRPEGDT
jgi:hypothetical protein